ncbi:MAG: NUDIX domain-containing protein [Gammaproteobacteria bacterium]|nr:NUDIX domain-containing protein [Gammaproteobacteria bacterium]MBU1655503.1 NUDIX domain-containing protein [Gammaproteobacteria bacterium]MBU1960822.1 NUDIX domain-containing protein [Gammaproteobacteria bacterium]
MSHQVEIIDSSQVYRGFLKLGSYRLRHTLFAGGWGRELVRERLEGLGAASVLLYDPDGDRVALLEQFRIGALEDGEGAWLLETVGGHIGVGEDAEQVARRESVEEAGCELRALIPICRFWVSPGISDERISLYCGIADLSGIGGIHGLEEEGEDIRVRVVSAEEALAELYVGRANSTSILIALQWLALNRERLRAGDY